MVNIGPQSRARICIVSEALSGALDEGLKNFTANLAAALRDKHEVVLITTATGAPAGGAQHVPAPRTFASKRLRGALVRAAPQLILYAARSSTTLMTFLRARVLKAYCPHATLVVLGLQTRRHSALQRQVIRHIRPDLVAVQSSANKQYLESLGCTTIVIQSGVDLVRFRPVGPNERQSLRARYDLAADRPVVVHVGHLQPGRNLQVLAELATRGRCQVVVVTSTSLEQKRELADELRNAGAIVVDRFIPHIEHFYQLADCYLFPVESSDNAIEVPLSVLEALAADLPVATTRFGGLPTLFAQHVPPGLVFADSKGDLLNAAERLALSRVRGTRSLAIPYSWQSIANSLVEQALERRRPRE